MFVHTHVVTNVKYYFTFFKGVRDLWVGNVLSESLYLGRENKLDFFFFLRNDQFTQVNGRLVTISVDIDFLLTMYFAWLWKKIFNLLGFSFLAY